LPVRNWARPLLDPSNAYADDKVSVASVPGPHEPRDPSKDASTAEMTFPNTVVMPIVTAAVVAHDADAGRGTLVVKGHVVGKPVPVYPEGGVGALAVPVNAPEERPDRAGHDR